MLSPRFIYSNDLRRFIGPMTGEEALLCERLEQQRQTQHRVRAYVADPAQKFTRIIALYLQWLQYNIHPDSHALLNLPDQKHPALFSDEPRAARIPRFMLNTAHAPFRSRGQPLPILQCVILDADRISPSRPYHSSRLDDMNRHSVSLLPTRADSVLIITGNPYRRRRNRFRHFWNRVMAALRKGEETPYQLIDTADPASALSPKELHPPARAPIALHSSLFTIHSTPDLNPDRCFSPADPIPDEEESSFTVIPA